MTALEEKLVEYCGRHDSARCLERLTDGKTCKHDSFVVRLGVSMTPSLQGGVDRVGLLREFDHDPLRPIQGFCARGAALG
jgi:hypothetical protein